MFRLNDLRLDDSPILTYPVSMPGIISFEGRETVVIAQMSRMRIRPAIVAWLTIIQRPID